MHKHKLTAMQTLLPLATSWIGKAPIAKTRTNVSSLLICNIPFLQLIIYVMQFTLRTIHN